MTTLTRAAVLSAVHGPGRETVAQEIGAPNLRAQVAAATAAGAHAFVCELPEGYDTPIGCDGVTLTPSERLRLAVAHLLVADPQLVVVDDPTAELDGAGEAAVLAGIEALLRGREVVVEAASPGVQAVAARAAGYRDLQQLAPRPGYRPPAVQALRPDPALPSLHRLLDPQEMAPLLGRTLAADRVPDVRVQSVRYKPGDNVVVQYSVATHEGWCTAVAYATAEARLGRKTHRSRNRRLAHRAAKRAPAPEPLAYVPEVSALVQWLPLDVRLPLISEGRRRLSRRLADAGVGNEERARPHLLRYWPRRRAVLRFGTHVLKVYRDSNDFTEALHGLRAAALLRKVRTPAYEAAIPRQHTTVQAYVHGHSPSMRPRSSHAAGALLADLHAESLPMLPTTSTADILAKSATRAEFVAYLLPGLKAELDALLAELAHSQPCDHAWVPSHGNFHAGQLLATPGDLILLDTDRMCLSAPAYDLASFAAHVAFGRPNESELVHATLESLLAGYRSRPEGLGWFLANCLLRRAPVPFRHQAENWPDAVTALVRSAHEALR